MSTLAALCTIRSQRAERYRRYLEALRDGPLPVRVGGEPPYLGGRRLADVFLEPDVLRRDRVWPRAEEGRQAHATDPASPRSRVPPREALDVGEAERSGDRDDDSEPVVERRVPWHIEQAGLGAGRWAAILGAPGQGKSLLVEMAVRDLARRSADAITAQSQSIDEVPLPIVTTAAELTARGVPPGESDEHALREALRIASARTCADEWMREELAACAPHARVTLFIDALDQIGSAEWATLDRFLRVLADWKNWQTKVILTARPYGWRPLDRARPLTEYRLAPLTPIQVATFVDSWFGQRTPVTPVRDLLARSPAVERLSTIPFLLTLICWIAEEDRIPDDVTRTEIYDRVVSRLLGTDPASGQYDERRATDWLAHLPKVALALFTESNGGRDQIRDACLVTLVARDREHRPPVPGGSPSLSAREKSRLLIEELSARRVLVPTGAEHAVYEFPHRSIWEYLAGRALAERLGTRRTSDPSWTLVDRKAWDPAWHEAIAFAVGRLSALEAARDPACRAGTLRRLVVDVLADEGRDDFFRHRLALAAGCLDEITGALKPTGAWIPVLCARSEAAWVPHVLADTRPAVAALEGALPRALWAVRNGAFSTLDGTNRPLDQLIARLSDNTEDGAIRKRVASALGALGPAAAGHSGLIDTLLARLTDQRRPALARSNAAETLAELGPAAAGPGLIDTLLARLMDERNDEVRSAVAHALEALGPAAAAHPGLIDTLLARLTDERDNKVRFSGARALRALGPAAAGHPGLIDTLLARLMDEGDDEVRYVVAGALGALGLAAAGHPGLIDTLLARFMDERNDEVRSAVAGALEALGPAAAGHSGLIDTLLARLTDERNYGVWSTSAVALALGALGATAAAHPGLIDTLLARLMDEGDYRVRCWVVFALGALGAAAAARPGLIDTLLARLMDEGDYRVRYFVANALWALGPAAAAHPGLIDTLLARLTDERVENIRFKVARALGALGPPAAAHPGLIDTLLVRLTDERDDYVRSAVADALGALGPPPRRPSGLIDTLLARLTDEREHQWVRLGVAKALGAQIIERGDVVATVLKPFVARGGVVATVLKPFVDQEGLAHLRCLCAITIGAWHGAADGLRIIRSGTRRRPAWSARPVSELSRLAETAGS